MEIDKDLFNLLDTAINEKRNLSSDEQMYFDKMFKQLMEQCDKKIGEPIG